MKESFRLGRIAGVAVGVNWSLLVIFALIAVSLSAGRLPAVYPDQSAAAYVVAGLVTAVLFFTSVLLHEISHAVVAQRNGIEVEGIVLWLFGGVAQLKGDAETPGAAFRIAAVGPFVSFALGLGFLAIAALLDGAGATGLVIESAVWLGIINIVLAVFNLFPGAPLDGGRVLRSILWKINGDKNRSWVQAARAGRVVGFVLIGLGILQFAAGAVGGLWLAFIGWFLLSAARMEESHAMMRGTLGDMRVSRLMSHDPVTAPADITVAQFLDDYVFRHRFSTFPVVDRDGRVVGLATVNRVKAVAPMERTSMRLAEMATPIDDVAVARPDEEVVDAIERLGGGEDGRVLVLDGQRVVGIISPVDVIRVMELSSLRSGERRPDPRSLGYGR
jgi:Zn-dependent protease/predicted transcriptional regulator